MRTFYERMAPMEWNCSYLAEFLNKHTVAAVVNAVSHLSEIMYEKEVVNLAKNDNEVYVLIFVSTFWYCEGEK